MSDDPMRDMGRKVGDFARKLANSPSEVNARMGIKTETGGEETRVDPPQPGAFAPSYRKPLQSPLGTELVSLSEGKAVMSVRVARRTWWILPYLMLPITIIGSFPLGMFIGTFANPFSMYGGGAWQNFFNAALWLTPVALVVINLVLWRWTQPWLQITATRDAIRMEDMLFDRKQTGGFRLGYELQMNVGVLKNGFDDINLGLQGLRLSYGYWGEDLPYLVNGYHANEIVMWLNFVVGKVGSPAEPDAQTGHRDNAY